MVQAVFSGGELQPIGLRRQDASGNHGKGFDCPGRLGSLPQPEFEPHGTELNGFDVTIWPRWQMVPLGGWRSVIISIPDGQVDTRQLSLHCNADVAAIARLRSIPRPTYSCNSRSRMAIAKRYFAPRLQQSLTRMDSTQR